MHPCIHYTIYNLVIIIYRTSVKYNGCMECSLYNHKYACQQLVNLLGCSKLHYHKKTQKLISPAILGLYLFGMLCLVKA